MGKPYSQDLRERGLRQLIRGLALMWPRYCFRPELRYLPSYSPDFNPIEQFFAKLKALL